MKNNDDVVNKRIKKLEELGIKPSPNKCVSLEKSKNKKKNKKKQKTTRTFDLFSKIESLAGIIQNLKQDIGDVKYSIDSQYVLYKNSENNVNESLSEEKKLINYCDIHMEWLDRISKSSSFKKIDLSFLKLPCGDINRVFVVKYKAMKMVKESSSTLSFTPFKDEELKEFALVYQILENEDDLIMQGFPYYRPKTLIDLSNFLLDL